MKLEIWRETTREGEVALEEGEHTVGGEGAEVVLPGVSRRLRLWVEQGRLSLEADGTVRVGGLRLPRQMRRLVMPGERIELGAVTLVPVAAPEERHPATRALAFDLLGGEAEAETPVHLTCLTGTDAGRRFAIGDGVTEIGRGEGATVRLRDRAVSRRQARLRREGQTYVLEDLGTPNGLYVDGARVAGRAVLTGGELIEIGESLLRFSAATPVSTPEPHALAGAAQGGSGHEASAAPESAAGSGAAPAASGAATSAASGPAASDARGAAPGALGAVASAASASAASAAFGAAASAGSKEAASGAPAAPERRPRPPHRKGDWLLIGLGVLVFGIGLLVSASCLRGGFSPAPSASPAPQVPHQDRSNR